jgi:hypothetical protein
MTPVLQRLSTLALRVLLRLSFLGQMALVVRHDFAHVANVVLVVFAGIFVRVLLQDLDDLAAAVEFNQTPSAHLAIEMSLIQFTHLSWPMVSPEPSSFDQPAPAESSPPSHSFSSSGPMLTSSLNSL